MTYQSWKGIVRRRDGYGLLLIFLLVDYLILSLVNSVRFGGLARSVPVALTVLLAVHTSNSRRIVVRAAQLAVASSLVFGTVQALTGSSDAGAICRLMVALVLVISPIAILRRILEHDKVGSSGMNVGKFVEMNWQLSL